MLTHDLLGRLGPFALIDIFGTILLGEFVLYLLTYDTTLKLRITMYFIMFFLSIFIHLLTNTKTPLIDMILI